MLHSREETTVESGLEEKVLRIEIEDRHLQVAPGQGRPPSGISESPVIYLLDTWT